MTLNALNFTKAKVFCPQPWPQSTPTLLPNPECKKSPAKFSSETTPDNEYKMQRRFRDYFNYMEDKKIDVIDI